MMEVESMSILDSTNAQLTVIEQQIGTVKLKLEKKREDLRRMKLAQEQLIGVRNDYNSKKDICLEPDFTIKTFYGRNANEFNSFRENELKASFVSISNNKTMDVIAKMMEKINDLQNEITALETRRSLLEGRRLTLISTRNEVDK